MKKNLLTMLSLVSGAAILTLSAQPVFADTGDTLGNNSEGTFKVEAGHLALDAVPNLDFGTLQVQDVAHGTTAQLTNAGEPLTVSDFRGSNHANWTLTAQLAPFTNKVGNQITGTIDLATDDTASKPAGGALDGSELWNNTAAGTNGTSSKSVKSAAATKLTLAPQADKAVGGSYTANITWTLNDTPTTAE